MNFDLFNEKINLIYDFLYNDNKEIYDVIDINLEKINPSDIIITKGKLSNEIIKQVLNQELQYLFTINNNIYFKIISNNISSLIKISISKKSYNDDFTSYILSELVLLNKTNNILLPIINITINLFDIKDILLKIELPKIFQEYFDKQINKDVSIKIREGFFNIMPMNIFINENLINYKSFLFKIIYTLSVIRLKYKYFKHNNLILENIFVYINKDSNEEFVFNNNKYFLPNENYQIKITNFEDAYMIDKGTENDLQKLAIDILKQNKNIDLNSKNFLTKLRDMKNNNIESLLNDQYFDDFKENKINKKIFTGIRNLNSEFNFNIDSDNELILGKQKKLKRIQQKGGYEKTSVPPYKAEKNNPFKTNDERTTFNKKQEDNNQPKNPPILLEQTVYDTSISKPVKQELPPAYVPLYNEQGQSIAVPFTHITNPAYNKPMQKVYNISLSNPLHDFTTVSKVYEDIIPGDPRSFTFMTIYERTQLINFMRNLIVENIDGESMNITGGKNSLLSSIKLLDLNPYTLNKNPFMDLGTNFLLYRAAYPIRYDQEKNNIYISKTGQGINVRLYNLTIGEMVGDEVNKNLDNFDFNLWRDLKYYNFIKKEIIEKKKSPNFIAPILYKKDNLSNVHWSKLSKLQNKQIEDNKELNRKAKLISNRNLVNYDDNKVLIYYFTSIDGTFGSEYVELKDRLSPYNNIKFYDINPLDPSSAGKISEFNITQFPFIIFKYDDKHIPYRENMTVDQIINFINTNIITLNSIIDVVTASGETIVLLTEAPHSNIIKWASPLYENYGSLRKMIATGFHKGEVWKSVLFQILYILYILEKEEIYFEEFSLESNIYIKDLYYDPASLKYWIYKINGHEYYVPNYGYLVLFDSKYSDTESGNFKIRSPKLFANKNDKFNYQNDEKLNVNYKDLIYHKFKEIFEPSVFNTKLKAQGGLEPEDVILNFIRDINNSNLGNIQDYFINHFKFYLNNRIGTELLRSEKEIINILNRPIFRKDQLLVRQIRYDEYEWVLFDSDVSPLIKKIITKDTNGNIIIQAVNVFSLLHYPSLEGMKPNNITENNIIETFNY
jgi:hypothetical protein